MKLKPIASGIKSAFLMNMSGSTLLKEPIIDHSLGVRMSKALQTSPEFQHHALEQSAKALTYLSQPRLVLSAQLVMPYPE